MDSHIKNLNLNLEMLKWIQGETNVTRDLWLEKEKIVR